MKNKLFKILGIAITLSMLASLITGLTVVPASAGSNEWTKFKTPVAGEVGDYFMSTSITDLGPIAKAIDDTLYCYAAGVGLMKSTNSGRTWTKLARYTGGQPKAIVPSSKTAGTIYITDGANVFKSTNAGTAWNTLTAVPDATVTGTAAVLAAHVSSMDVGYDGNTAIIYLGVMQDAVDGYGDVYLFSESVSSTGWVKMNVASNRKLRTSTAGTKPWLPNVSPEPAWGDGASVFAVKVSPLYATDAMVMAVVTADRDNDGTWNPEGTVVTQKWDGAQWGANTGDTDLKYDVAGVPTHFVVTGTAVIYIPSGYDSDGAAGKNEYFVGINGADTAAAAPGTPVAAGDVYRVFGTNGFDLDINGSNSGVDVSGLDGAGTVLDVDMIAGTAGGYQFYSTDNGENWAEPAKEATGVGEAYPILLKDFATKKEAIVAVGGADAAVSLTRDNGVTWNGISLLDYDFDYIVDLAVPANYATKATLFAVTNDDSLFKYDGTYWERWMHESLLSTAGGYIDSVQLSPDFATSNIVFIYANDGVDERPWRSTDGGNKWTKLPVYPGNNRNTHQGWLVIDRNNLIISRDGTSGVNRTTNGGNSWTPITTGFSGSIVDFALDPKSSSNVLAGNDAGSVFLSTNGGAVWKQTPMGSTVPGDEENIFVAFSPSYATDKFIYAANSDWEGGQVYRLKVGTDDDWKQISGLAGTYHETIYGYASLDVEPRRNLRVGENGVLYVNAVMNDWDDSVPVARCVNPTAADEPALWAPYFEPVDKDYPGAPDAGDWANSLEVTKSAAGGNMLFIINDEEDQIWVYTDDITTPVLSAPADGSSSGREGQAQLSWKAVTGATEYYVWWDIDPGFANVSEGVKNAVTTSASYLVTGLEPGRTYYWRVAVADDSPVSSAFPTKPFSFTTALGPSQWNPFIGGVPETPAEGATNVPLQPSFAWNPADWATGYEFELSTSPAVGADGKFTTSQVSRTGAAALTTPVFKIDFNLAYSTTYYWHVRAVSATSRSEWATGVFTTIAQAPPPPTQPPVSPTPPPQTPAYIWTIIGIGAALVIAVIILIIRTRRVA